MTGLHPEFVPISVLSALSLLLPLPWHWRARNVATLAMIVWLFSVNVIFAVDAAIWGDNVKKVIPIWCDISTYFKVPFLLPELMEHYSYENPRWSKLCPPSSMLLHLCSPRKSRIRPTVPSNIL